MYIPLKEKHPDEVLNFGHTFATMFGESDSISTSEWAVSPAGDLTIDSDTSDDTTTDVVVSGGTLGKGYDLVNTVVTGTGKTYVRTIRIVCVQR